MLSKRVAVAFVALLGLVLMGPVALYAQTSNSGTIVGLVTDPSGAVVAGASVSVTDVTTNQSRTTVTNADGRYTVVNIPPGTYDVTITKTGFRATKFSKQNVIVSTQLTLNAVLQLGAASEVIEVTATAGAELQTLNSTVGNTVQHNELLQLPNLGRDATTFATLQPGTNITGNTAGAVADQNTFQLDGGAITDDMSGDSNTYIPSFASDAGSGIGTYHSGGYNASSSGVIPTPVESIEEFKVGVSNQTADFNQGAGSQVQMVTKRGTNAVHGSAYEYYTDNNFGGANTWDNNSTNTPQPSAHYSRFGGSLGGPIIWKDFLGGKWYLFGNYEGFRYPFSQTFERNYPTASMRLGLIKINGQTVNLNPNPVVDPATGNTIAPTPCPASPNGLCDPQGIGINPVVQNLWNTYTPLPNDCNSNHGDNLNYCGYKGTISLPQTSNFGVVRLDHDFGPKWHFNATYHYYRLDRATTNQVDVGGFFPGDTFGDYASTANRPQIPWYYTATMTTEISPTLSNDFHYSGTRNYWAYGTFGGVPQIAGFPAAFELGGESSGTYQPYNTDNQNTRTRYWNGHDNLFRDDVTKVLGKHLIQFGGSYLRNYDQHQRIDNGGTINIYEQYLIGLGSSTSLSSAGIDISNYIPAGVTSTAKYGNLYSQILGMVSETQGLFTRNNGTAATGLTLKTQSSCAIPGVPGTSGCVTTPPALNQSVIDTYNIYAGDTWQVKPGFTLNYGLGWTVELPPVENNGNQGITVDAAGNQLNVIQYLAALKGAAEQGLTYTPNIGFATIPNVNGHPKYPYSTFYGGFSPRISAAWNPNYDEGLMGKLFGNGKTVIRGGFATIFGRLNGVDQVLVPILAPGLMQTATCLGPTVMNTCGNADPTDVYRVNNANKVAFLPAPPASLPQPWYPGVNSVSTGPGEGLDPGFRPNVSYEFNFNIQRQLSSKIRMDIGYIGRIIHNEFQAYNLNVVPYMMNQGGQTYANAWKNLTLATGAGNHISTCAPVTMAMPVPPACPVPVQPFFETALGGATSAYCAPFVANNPGNPCTAAFVSNEAINISCACAYDAWNDLSSTGNFVFGRSLPSDPYIDPMTGLPTANGANGQSPAIFENTSTGWGNYNAAYFSLSFQDWHGLTMKSNFTFSKTLGTGAVVQASSEYTVVDPFNLQNMYGVQPYDQKFAYNLYFNYNLPWYKDQRGVAGHILGGWSIAPLFVAGSGFPTAVNTGNGDCESYGEGNCIYQFTYENAISTAPPNYTPTRKQPTITANDAGNCCANGNGVVQDVFNNPTAAFNTFRNPILGLDGQIGGGGQFHGLPFWNMDLAINKNTKVTERVSFNLYVAFTNFFNHMQPADPFMCTCDPSTFGVLGATYFSGGNVQANTPRRMELGLRVAW